MKRPTGPFRLVATDLDRTLLNERGEVSAYTAQVLAQCRARGILVAFATARPERTTRPFQAAFLPDYILANNGATIACRGETIHNAVIPPETLRTFVDVLLANPHVSEVALEAGDRVLVGEPTADDWGPGWNPVVADLSILPKNSVPKMSFACGDARLVAEIAAAFPSLALSANTGEVWHQVVAAGQSKAAAIGYIARREGFSIAEVVAFGDDYNDIDMLRQCGFGVAVENAIDAVKAVSNDICPRHSADGVAHWLASALSQI